MKITNRFNIPLSLAVWLAHDDYNRSDDPTVISATTILKSTKSILLSRQAELGDQDISELIASSVGTALHSAIDKAWSADTVKSSLSALGYPSSVVDNILINPSTEELYEGCIPVYKELRRTKEILNWKITGQFDFISNGKLEDFKSTGTYSWINQSNRDKYIQQASIYRWLFPELITEDIFSINYIFTDWSSVKARQDSSYPQKRLIQQDYPLMSKEATETFIRQKLAELNKYANSSQHEIPNCTAEELWLKPSVFKYYKNPANKTRSTKNFDSYWEANLLYTTDGSVGEIVEVKGEAGFCKYCNAVNICDQAKQLTLEGRLIV